MTWSQAWQKLSRIALYRAGPDVSQIGTTWLDSFVAAGAVRPFADEEVEEIGGQTIFLPVSWQTVSPPIWKSKVWAIPWLFDVRVIFYWRDMLEQAGIDEQEAFRTPEKLEQTLARLQHSGITTPWGIFAYGQHSPVQIAASWIWGSGGSFVSADGERILFDRPEACEGILAFLRLRRHMPPDARNVEEIDARNLFVARQVAVIMGIGGWLQWMYNHASIPDVADKLGVAIPPGPAFVGGSNLVVWQHSCQAQEAVDLIRFLVSKEAQLDYCHHAGLLPVRPDVFAEPPYATDPHYQTIGEALRTGRAFPVVPKWEIIEGKLADAMIWLWNALLAASDQDVDALIIPYVRSVARRLTESLQLEG